MVSGRDWISRSRWGGALLAVSLFTASCPGVEDELALHTLEHRAFIKASNTGAEHLLGYSVGLWGDTLAASAVLESGGSPGINGPADNDDAPGSGAVYVFRTSGRSWVQEAYIKASNPNVDDRFGRSLALHQQTLVVGAPGEGSSATGVDGDQCDDSAPDSGAVYVFRRAGNTWAQEAYIKASNAGAGDGLGWSVALHGDTLVAGAPWEDSGAAGVGGDQDDSSAPASGAVYVFRRAGNTWAQEAYIKASSPRPMSGFGWSVALHDDALAVGAPGESSSATGIDGDETDTGMPASGAVYLFRRSGAGWAQEAYIKASNTGAGYGFGWTVAITDETLAVGAPAEASSATGVDGDQTDTSLPYSGAVYVFGRSSGGWAQNAYIKASNPDVLDLFGSKVVLSGNVLAVSAINEASSATGVGGDQSDNSVPESGAVYLFARTGDTWAQAMYVKASNTGTDDNFGYGMAIHGNALAVGAPGEDSGDTGVGADQDDHSAPFSGAVHVYR